MQITGTLRKPDNIHKVIKRRAREQFPPKLSLNFRLVGAESKLLKQSKLQEVRHDSEN